MTERCDKRMYERRMQPLVTEGCLPTEQTVASPRCHPRPDAMGVSDRDAHSVIHSVYDPECPRMQRSFLSESFLLAQEGKANAYVHFQTPGRVPW